MVKLKSTIIIVLVLALAFSLCGCSSVPLLKGSEFSPAYKGFIGSMQKTLPVSVAYEQYLKPDGFQADKLITDTDQVTMRELVDALAQVKITEQVETASNFAVKHYTFTDKNGDTFTFEFFGSCLKAEGKFYKTENSRPFISVRIEQKESGEMIAALDEAYDGVGEYAGKRYIACRVLEQNGEEQSVKTHADYELADTAVITAPTDHDNLQEVSTVTAQAFFANFEQVKGQDNANYVFRMTVEKGVIVKLEFFDILIN